MQYGPVCVVWTPVDGVCVCVATSTAHNQQIYGNYFGFNVTVILSHNILHSFGLVHAVPIEMKTYIRAPPRLHHPRTKKKTQTTATLSSPAAAPTVSTGKMQFSPQS